LEGDKYRQGKFQKKTGGPKGEDLIGNSHHYGQPKHNSTRNHCWNHSNIKRNRNTTLWRRHLLYLRAFCIEAEGFYKGRLTQVRWFFRGI